LTLALFFLPQVIRDRRTRFLLIAGFVGLLSSALVVFFNINYVAPIAPVIVAVIVQGMRHLSVWKFEGRQSGLFLVRAIVLMCIVMVPVQVHLLAAAPAAGSWPAIGPARAAVIAQLSGLAGPQLVLVRYEAKHNPMLEWVYNGAEIDKQKIVWARDMGVDRNEELLHYYPMRRFWLLEADAVPPRLTEYSAAVPQLSANTQHASRPQETER
jgi:hypothetical protein